MGDVAELITALAGHIITTHIHDNDGTRDAHLFPYLASGGTIDWKETMDLLRSREDQYALLLELKEVPGMENRFAKVQEVFERLENE